MDLCRGNRLKVWNIHMDKDAYVCCMSISDYWKTKKIARKTGVCPKIMKKPGFPFWIHQSKKKKGIVFGIFSGILVMYGLRLFLWEISIVGEQYYTEEQLLKYLRRHGLTVGLPIVSLQCSQIEDQLRDAFQNIGWVSAKIEGTRLTIIVIETKEVNEAKEKKEPSHLVAPEDGMICSIVTRAGTPAVKKGDRVKKGDILISGVVEYTNDEGSVFLKNGVFAEGDVVIQYEKKYRDQCKFLHTEKVYSGFEKTVNQCTCLGKKFYFTNPIKSFNKNKKYDIMSDEYTLSLNQSFVLPVRIGKIRYKEYEEKQKKYTGREARKILEQRFRQYQKDLLEENCSVIKENVQIEKQTEQLVLQGGITIQEKVQSYKKVKKEEWRMEAADGLDGNHD